MSALKVLFTALFGGICLALALGTVVVTISLGPEDNRWLWFAGLLFASVSMGTLFFLFLAREDRSFTVGGARRH